MTQSAIDVQDLLARELVIEWFESVALVQSVCRRLVASGGAASSFPATTGTLLAPDGSVSVPGPFFEAQPVESAARLLADMSGSDMPVQLRLVITQAAAPGSPYNGLEEFSRALAYFERSEPQQILQQLHARAIDAPRRVGDARVPVLTPASQDADPQSADTRRKKNKQRSQMPLVAGLATVVGLSVAGWMGGGLPAVGSPLTQGMTLFENTVRAKLGAPPVDAPAPEAPAPVPVEAGRPSSRTPPQISGRTAPAARPSTGTALRSASTPVAAPDSSALERLALAEPLTFAPLTAGVVAPRFYSSVDIVAYEGTGRAGAGDPGPIYTPRDANVIPPRAVYPQLPAAPADGVSPGQTIVDLVIDPTGHVEGARLRTAPRNIHEFMLLSATKAWRFDPAVHEDGHPVRFRHSVVITAYP
jgi:hypothetical protein